MNNPLSNLKRPSASYPRQFISNDTNLNSWEGIQAIFTNLLERDISTLKLLQKWIKDWSETEAVIGEESSRLYINMTCDTENKDHEAAFQNFVENIEPKLSPVNDQLNKKLLASPTHKELDNYYDCWVRDIKTGIELFKDENIEIDTQIALETQYYQKTTGSMSIEHEGKTLTLQQMNAKLESPERNTREEAWRKVANRRLEDKDKLNEHFEKLFKLRLQVSKNCGFDSYLPYIFKAKGRYDYTPKHCEDFQKAIEKVVVPKVKAIRLKRQKALGLSSLRPWDTACDPLGREALKPFSTSEELCKGVSQIFKEIDSKLSAWFDQMVSENLLDLDSRLGKAPGGYQIGLEENRVPFIFMNAVGTMGDVFTLLHEAGHSFHQFLMQEHDLTSYRDINAEIAEVASMSMEMIGATFLEKIIDSEGANRARNDQLEDSLLLLPWVAQVDAFQHWMYSNPNHNLAERTAKWIELDNRFAGAGIDWSGLEEERESAWHRQLHIFEVPFYYVEYGIAQLGALQVWKNWKENSNKGLELYKNGLALGSSRPLPELFEKTGVAFDFSTEIITPLIDQVWSEIQKK